MTKILLIFILTTLAVSGCIEEKEIAPTPAVPEISQPELFENGYFARVKTVPII